MTTGRIMRDVHTGRVMRDLATGRIMRAAPGCVYCTAVPTPTVVRVTFADFVTSTGYTGCAEAANGMWDVPRESGCVWRKVFSGDFGVRDGFAPYTSMEINLEVVGEQETAFLWKLIRDGGAYSTCFTSYWPPYLKLAHASSGHCLVIDTELAAFGPMDSAYPGRIIVEHVG